MKASELRIGNWAFSNLTRQNFTVTPEGIYYINSDESVAEPIPITEDWLLRFGFEKCYPVIGAGYQIANGIIDANIINNEVVINVCYGQYAEYGIPVKHIKYVYQLQNLYFALTGTELELKEKVNA